MPQVLLIDDHELLSRGLQAQLKSQGVEAAYVHPRDAARLNMPAEYPEVSLVVVDLMMPGVNTNELVGQIAAAGITVLMLSGSEDERSLAQCLRAGAMAIIGKDEPLDTIIDLIVDGVRGRAVRFTDRASRLALLDSQLAQERRSGERFTSLSNRERTVLSALCNGATPAEIAQQEVVGIETVRTQIKSITRKLGVNSQVAAVAAAYSAGLPFLDPVTD